MTIGNTLRQARETRMIRLDEVENETKIFRKYLEALENEHFHILPGRVYARSYLITYARFVGLDTADMLQIFDRLYPPGTQDAAGTPAVLPRLTLLKNPFKYKVTTHTRLSKDRDLHIMRRTRIILAEKKRLPGWLRPLKRLLRCFISMK